MKLGKENNLMAYMYLTPALLFFVTFIVAPMLYTLYLSFFDWNMVRPTKEFVGLDNYIEIFTNKYFIKILLNSLSYILILLVLNFTLPYVFSFVCKFVLTRMQTFYKVAFFLPAFISLVVGSMLFTWILNPISGPIAQIGKIVGFTLPVWTTTEGLVIVVISLITSWKSFGYNFITLYAAVTSVPIEVIEQARLDNIPLHKIFLNIVAPMSSAAGYYVFIITIVQGLEYVYAPIEVLTKGGPDYGSTNLIYDSFYRAFAIFDTGSSAALSVVTLLFFGLGILLINQTLGKKVYYEN